MTVSLHHRLSADVRDLPVGMHLLGGVAYASSSPIEGAPVLAVDVPVLSGAPGVASLLLTDRAGRPGHHGPVRYCATDALLFGVVEMPASALESATMAAYAAVFETLAALGYPTLMRAWNYMPDINAEADGLERYRQFNAGRQRAFAASDRPREGRVPAACALGTRSGSLGVAFLAGVMPFIPVENPRQVSAYHYPPAYGELSPTFSRAGLARLGTADALFVSGTAAIVGHASLHAHDIEAQTQETLANLEAVVAAANAVPGAASHCLEDLDFTVYVRHARDAACVMARLHDRVGASARAICVQADVCREELLVEIEAIGGVPRGEAE